VGLERLDGDADRLEAAGLDFHRAVNSAFRHLAELDPERYLVVDASEDVEVIQGRIREVVLPLVGRPVGSDEAPAGQTGQPVDGVPVTATRDERETAPRLPPTEELRGDLAGRRDNPGPEDAVPTAELPEKPQDAQIDEVATTKLPTETSSDPDRKRG
jgi:hypothetical protein